MQLPHPHLLILLTGLTTFSHALTSQCFLHGATADPKAILPIVKYWCNHPNKPFPTLSPGQRYDFPDIFPAKNIPDAVYTEKDGKTPKTVHLSLAFENNSPAPWTPDKHKCIEAAERLLDTSSKVFNGCVSGNACCDTWLMPADTTAGGRVEVEDLRWLEIDPNDN